jgi:uncharacterized protein (TIGR02646 family)
MRPVFRGPVPELNGNPKTVNDYKDWRQDLIDRIGKYCSYCNMTLNDSPQVEHVTARDINPALRLDWDNMVLACGPCNRAKSNLPCPTSTHYLPDFHNTHLAFDYVVVDHPSRSSQKACIPVPNATLSPIQRQKAQNTIDLCKLNVLTNTPRATDLRWKYRFDAFLIAQIWRDNWDDWGNSVATNFIELLLTAALEKGFFSVWFHAFRDVAEVKKALIEGFPNTHAGSFDSNNNFDPVNRNLDDL